MAKKFDPDAELKKVGAKLRKEQHKSNEEFIKNLEREKKDEDSRRKP